MADNQNKKGPSFFSRFFDKIKSNISGKNGNNKSGELVIALTPPALVLSVYILLLISKFIDITLLNRDNEYLSIIILQMMIFLLPASLWCMLKGEKYIKGLRISAPKPDALLLMICGALVMMTSSSLILMLFDGTKEASSSFSLYGTFISKRDGSLANDIYLIVAYAALPAVCEEFVFRGILCREFEGKGVFRAVILSSLFFSLLHFNVYNLPIYFLCGCMLALVMYATRSVWGAVITHFLYNIFGIFGQPYMATLYRLTKDSRLLIMIVGILFFLSAALFCAEASKLYRKYLRAGIKASYRRNAPVAGAYFKEAFSDIIRDPFAIASVLVYIFAVLISLL